MIAAAQVTSGELVRVKTVDGSKVVGTVSEVTGSGLGLSFPNGVSENISFDEMESLHRIIGRRSYRGRSALIGSGAGVITGIAIGIATSQSCDDVDDVFGDDVFDDTCDFSVFKWSFSI